MANNHILTRNIGDLRGFSTDSEYLRPPNVASTAINLQRAPDGTLQLRRGYQCQIGSIGGMGCGTYFDPTIQQNRTVTIGTDGYLYNKLEKQIYLYYNGQITGAITDISQSLPCNVESVSHGLITGTNVILRDIGGMTNLNNFTYKITVVDPDNFTLDGVDSTLYPAYTSGGEWSIAFADNRYLTFTIFTDPRFLNTNLGWSFQQWSLSPWGAPSGESITCNITVNRAARVDGDQVNTNTINVEFGSELAASDTIQFYSSSGVFNQRVVLSATTTSVTFGGYPVSVLDGTYVSQFFDIIFRKGYDVSYPFSIASFIANITDPVTGIEGLLVAINGDDFYPAAFIQIIEPVIIDSNKEFILNYWYWQQVNSTTNPPFPGSANTTYQNSPDFENAVFQAYDDIIYITNGWDYPQKYDGQTVYRTGMPTGNRPSAADDTGADIKPFSDTEVYQYAITYEQIDAQGHIVEGVLSEIWIHTVSDTSATDVTVENLSATSSANWNTNCAIAAGGQSTVYGPDGNGFYYDLTSVDSGYTLKIGDSGYYLDETCAQIDGDQSDTVNIDVVAGHNILEGDIVYFEDSTPNVIQRIVTRIADTVITIQGSPVTVDDGTAMQVYKVSRVFGDVAIIDSDQTDVNIITVDSGHTIQVDDVVELIDANDNLQRRTITAVSSSSVTVDGIPVSVIDNRLISSINQQDDTINLQRTASGAATLGTDAPISNNLRINIYRTHVNSDFFVIKEIYLVASIPNDSFDLNQIYLDEIADAEINLLYSSPGFNPNSPPICKYLKSFGNQMLYAGGERGNPINSDLVFFSQGNLPESVDLARNSYGVPNADDDITGIGIAGTTLITTKNRSIWAITGNLLAGQINVVQISPGTNIGCSAHASIASVGTLMYFLYDNGVYAITENQLYPTDPFGNPIPISLMVDALFRVTPYIPSTRFVYKRAVALNYTKDNQYLLFLPCEDTQSTIRTANVFSQLLCYDYQGKNWFTWLNMNAAGGMLSIDDDLYFQERKTSAVNGNVANFYKQHRFYRLVDHADHAGSQRIEWRSSWTDLGQPEVRKKFSRCVLLMDRLSQLLQYNNPEMYFSSYLDRIPTVRNTFAKVTQVDNIRNSSWNYSGWGWGFWSGYQDPFIRINLRQGTVAKSMQIGFTMQGINMDIRFAGFQLETIPENRRTIAR